MEIGNLNYFFVKLKLGKMIYITFLMFCFSLSPIECWSVDALNGSIDANAISDKEGSSPLSEMEKMREAMEIKIYIDTPYTERRLWNDESSLTEMGCLYKTNNTYYINELLNFISKSNMQLDSIKSFPHGIREAIYFELRDHSQIKILFRQNFKDAKRVRGVLDGKNVSVDSILIEQLYGMAAKIGGENECSDFLSKYKK